MGSRKWAKQSYEEGSEVRGKEEGKGGEEGRVCS